MKRLLPLVFLLTAAMMAQVRPRLNPRQNDTGPKGSVSGTVVDSLSGAPVRKARVNISGASNATAITDAAGAFSFDQVSAGSLIVGAEHSDYPKRSSTARPGVRIEIAPGEEKRGVELRLDPAASLEGRITDEDGDPIASCFITVLTDPSRPVIGALTMTDKHGEYVLERVPAGRYRIQARCNASNLQPRPFAPPNAVLPGRQLAYGTRYYPDASDVTSARKVSVAAGQTLRGLDFHMSPEPVSSLAVRIVGASSPDLGRIQGSLSVASTLHPLRNESFNAFLQPQTGEMIFTAVRPGDYRLRIIAGGAGSVLLASQLVQITEESKRIAVNAVMPSPLSGAVIPSVEKEEAAQPPSNRRGSPLGRVVLTSIDDQMLTSSTEIKQDGSFSFLGVSPGRYRVAVMSRQWVQSVALDGALSDGQEIEIKPGGGGSLEIHTGRETGIVSGDLQGLPSNAMKIHLFTTSLDFSNPSIQNDFGEFPAQPAHYSVQIFPGRYRLYATVLGTGEDLSPIIESENLFSRGEEIDVRPGKEMVRNLKIITAEDIRKESP